MFISCKLLASGEGYEIREAFRRKQHASKFDVRVVFKSGSFSLVLLSNTYSTKTLLIKDQFLNVVAPNTL